MIVLLEPPPQYDHPYRGPVVEQRLSVLQIIQLCRGLGEGCAFVDKGVCHIALPSDEKDTRLMALMRRHEVAHCNGWPSHHPGGRSVEYDAEKHTPTFKFGHVGVTLY
jgi:hypothetical protein